MIERTYGTTGIKVAILGFGAARLPESALGRRRFDYEQSVPVVRRAIDLGVNYTLHGYELRLFEELKAQG